MKNFIKNLGLLIVVLVISYFTAEYFGMWYDKFSPQYDSFFGASSEVMRTVVGAPFAYVFFITFIFTLFGFGNRKKWLFWLLVPPTILWFLADKYYIYLPIILALIAFGLAKLALFLHSKITKTE